MRLCLVVLAFGAQGIHLANLADQQRVWWGYGLFFLIVASAQGLLAVALLFDRPARRLALAGAICNGVVALTWVVARLGGFPGLFAFERLGVGDQGLATTLLELTLVVSLIGYVVRPAEPRIE